MSLYLLGIKNAKATVYWIVIYELSGFFLNLVIKRPLIGLVLGKNVLKCVTSTSKKLFWVNVVSCICYHIMYIWIFCVIE